MTDRTGIDYTTTQNMIEAARKEAIAASGAQSPAAIGGFSDLVPIGPWPVSVRQFKGKAFVTLKVAVPSGCIRLKTILEQYTGSGTSVTVVRRVTDSEKELPDSITAGGGVFTFEFDLGLSFNAKYGCPKLAAVLVNGGRIVNQINDEGSPRVEADYFVDSLFTLGDAFGAISAPASNLITYNSLDPITPDIYDAHAGLKVYAPTTDAGAAQTWGAFLGNAQTATVQAIINRDYGPDGIIDTPYPHVLKDLELTQVDPTSTPANRGFVVIEANNLIPGGQYSWIENKVSVNGEKKTATGNVAFTAANFSTDITQLTNLALSVVSTDPFDGKHVQPFLEFTQPATPVALKNYTVKLKKSSVTTFPPPIVHRGLSVQTEALHLQLNAGTISITNGTKNMVGVGTNFTRLQEGWKIKQGAQTLIIDSITDDTHLITTVNATATITSQSYVVVCVISLIASMKVKPSTTYNLQVILRARGITVTTLNLTFSTDADGNVIVDADVPSLASPSTPTITDEDGHLYGNAPPPTANIHTLKTIYFVMSTSNVHPTNSVVPTLGVDGVVQIKYGQHVHFKPKRPQTVNLYFYYIAENDVGLSAWSTGVLLTPAGITRPILDNVALAVPTLSERMERSATSGTGHDANHFVLDAGASAVDDFYNNMFLHIPSFDGGTASQKSSTIRRITDYVGSTRTCTIGIAFDSTPVGVIAYDIWRAEILTQGNYGDHGAKSRTTHSTTTFQLSFADSNGVANFFLGYTIYIPSFALADQIRKISGYDEFNGIVTVDTPFSVNHNGENHGYLLVNGSIGYSSAANASSQTGSPAPVPFRWYLDSNKNYRFEILPPTGADANALTHSRIQLRRESNGVTRGDTGASPIGSSTPPTLPAIASNSAATILLRNNYRGPNQDGTSDGWSDESYHVHVGSSADNANYDPSVYGRQPILDYEGPNSYPIRISSY